MQAKTGDWHRTEHSEKNFVAKNLNLKEATQGYGDEKPFLRDAGASI